VNVALLGLYSSPFTVTPTATAVAPVVDVVEFETEDKMSASGGVMQRTVVELTKVAPEETGPKRHRRSLVSTNPEPVTDTAVLPTTGPFGGSMRATSGASWYQNSAADRLKSWPLLLTCTETSRSCPALTVLAAGGDTHVTVESSTYCPATTAEPKRHVSAVSSTKALPLTVTAVPPTVTPEFGTRDATSGKEV
jgi:hypothetical protein